MNIINQIHLTSKNFVNSLVKDVAIPESITRQKTIIAVACIAFSILASCFLLFRNTQLANQIKKIDDAQQETIKKIKEFEDLQLEGAKAKAESEAEIAKLKADLKKFNVEPKVVVENEPAEVNVVIHSQPKVEAGQTAVSQALELAQAKAKELKEKIDAVYTVGDIGTGDVSLKGFKFDFNSKCVYGVGERITVDKTTAPEVFIENLKKNIPLTGEAILYGTSWARIPNDADKQVLDLLSALSKECPHIKSKVMSQADEAEISSYSLANILLFKNSNNPALAGVTSQNTIQLEGGKGSIQSHAVLPQQKSEKSGTWVNNEIKSGKTLEEVKNALKAELKSELKGPEAVKDIKNIAMQGLFAVALQDAAIMKALNVKKEEWIVGEVAVALPQVIAALQEKLTSVEQAAKAEKEDKAKMGVLQKSAPALACLAILEAFQEQYGNDFNVLAMKEDAKLFNQDGKQIGEAKVTGSHGVAVKYFKDLEQEYEKCLAEIAKLSPNKA